MRTPEEIQKSENTVRSNYPELNDEEVTLMDEFLEDWVTILIRIAERELESERSGLTPTSNSDIQKTTEHKHNDLE